MTEINLGYALLTLSLIGFVLALWAMSLAANNLVGRDEKTCLRWVRRSSLALIAGGMLWASAYGFERDWQPWPPFLMVMGGIDLMLLGAVITGQIRHSEMMRRDFRAKSIAGFQSGVVNRKS